MSKKTPEALRTAKNPFIESLIIPVVARQVVEDLIIAGKIQQDKDTGLITSVGPINKISKGYVIERDRKVDLYYENNGVDLRGDYTSLSKEGRMLLEYIIFYCLRENKTHCYIDFQDFMEKYQIKSRTTAWNCKKVLIDNAFIAPTSYQSWFWINPKYMFKGHRTKVQELNHCLKFMKND